MKFHDFDAVSIDFYPWFEGPNDPLYNMTHLCCIDYYGKVPVKI